MNDLTTLYPLNDDVTGESAALALADPDTNEVTGEIAGSVCLTDRTDPGIRAPS